MSTAVPIISNIIPISIKTRAIIINKIELLNFDINKLDAELKIKAIKKVIKNAFRIQLSFFIFNKLLTFKKLAWNTIN